MPLNDGHTSRSDSHSSSPVPKRYLELCISHSSSKKRLSEVDISDVQDDDMFFRLIRDRYLSVPRFWTKTIYLPSPVDVESVRVGGPASPVIIIVALMLGSSLLKTAIMFGSLKSLRVGHRKEEVEKRRWEFEHPMPAAAFYHFFQSSEAHHQNGWLP